MQETRAGLTDLSATSRTEEAMSMLNPFSPALALLAARPISLTKLEVASVFLSWMMRLSVAGSLARRFLAIGYPKKGVARVVSIHVYLLRKGMSPVQPRLIGGHGSVGVWNPPGRRQRLSRDEHKKVRSCAPILPSPMKPYVAKFVEVEAKDLLWLELVEVERVGNLARLEKWEETEEIEDRMVVTMGDGEELNCWDTKMKIWTAQDVRSNGLHEMEGPRYV